MSNILWCMRNPPTIEQRLLFPGDNIDTLGSISKLFDEIYKEHKDNLSVIDSAVEFYKALEDIAFDYHTIVLPNDLPFLAEFFYHAGIEMGSTKDNLKCIIFTDELMFYSITIMV